MADCSGDGAALLQWGRKLTEPTLRDAVDTLPGSLRHMAGYHFGWWDRDGNSLEAYGGKALRPTLVFLSAEAVGAPAAVATPAAVAIELVHNFTLIHDDLMDGDALRRHRPTVWKEFGAGQAILAGNALMTLAFDVLAGVHAAHAPRALKLLHTTVVDLLHGQAADLAFEQRDDVQVAECVTMMRHKTASLLECCATLGALLGGGTAAEMTSLRRFAGDVGLAFQVVDDLLGIWGDPERTGKPAFSDLHGGKKSLPVVVALTSDTDAGRRLAAGYHRLRGAEVTTLAQLIEEAGAREWCQRQADEAIDRAVGAPAITADLASFARLVTTWRP